MLFLLVYITSYTPAEKVHKCFTIYQVCITILLFIQTIYLLVHFYLFFFFDKLQILTFKLTFKDVIYS